MFAWLDRIDDRDNECIVKEEKKTMDAIHGSLTKMHFEYIIGSLLIIPFSPFSFNKKTTSNLLNVWKRLWRLFWHCTQNYVGCSNPDMLRIHNVNNIELTKNKLFYTNERIYFDIELSFNSFPIWKSVTGCEFVT